MSLSQLQDTWKKPKLDIKYPVKMLHKLDTNWDSEMELTEDPLYTLNITNLIGGEPDGGGDNKEGDGLDPPADLTAAAPAPDATDGADPADGDTDVAADVADVAADADVVAPAPTPVPDAPAPTPVPDAPAPTPAPTLATSPATESTTVPTKAPTLGSTDPVNATVPTKPEAGTGTADKPVNRSGSLRTADTDRFKDDFLYKIHPTEYYSKYGATEADNGKGFYANYQFAKYNRVKAAQDKIKKMEEIANKIAKNLSTEALLKAQQKISFATRDIYGLLEMLRKLDPKETDDSDLHGLLHSIDKLNDVMAGRLGTDDPAYFQHLMTVCIEIYSRIENTDLTDTSLSLDELEKKIQVLTKFGEMVKSACDLYRGIGNIDETAQAIQNAFPIGKRFEFSETWKLTKKSEAKEGDESSTPENVKIGNTDVTQMTHQKIIAAFQEFLIKHGKVLEGNTGEVIDQLTNKKTDAYNLYYLALSCVLTTGEDFIQLFNNINNLYTSINMEDDVTAIQKMGEQLIKPMLLEQLSRVQLGGESNGTPSDWETTLYPKLKKIYEDYMAGRETVSQPVVEEPADVKDVVEEPVVPEPAKTKEERKANAKAQAELVTRNVTAPGAASDPPEMVKDAKGGSRKVRMSRKERMNKKEMQYKKKYLKYKLKYLQRRKEMSH